MMIAHMDTPITRRKRYILVTGEDGAILFRCKYMWQLVAYMDAVDQQEYLIALEGSAPVLRVNRLHSETEQEKWQS